MVKAVQKETSDLCDVFYFKPKNLRNQLCKDLKIPAWCMSVRIGLKFGSQKKHSHVEGKRKGFHKWFLEKNFRKKTLKKKVTKEEKTNMTPE